MVTLINVIHGYDHDIHEYEAKSTDAKPTNAPDKSELYEIDTANYFIFDGDTTTWINQTDL